MKKKNNVEIHNIEPIYDKDSKILILGSFPSVKSREQGFYYANPQNQFFTIMEIIFNEKITDKKRFLLDKHIALWDVVHSCEIKGSADSSIKNVKTNDIKYLIDNSKINKIFTTGKKAYELYNKYLKNTVNIEAIYLPSTSPLYKSMNLNEKIRKYSEILKFL